MSQPLPAALSGERFEFASSAGRLSCYVDGAGPPLLLIHSVNAAGSAAEVRPLYEHYRTQRTVFALDLPGFGFSERTDRLYTPRIMTDAVLAVVEEIRTRCGSSPLDALAVSLGCEFLARAAAEEPELFRTLALVSPTGFSGNRDLRGPAGSTLEMPWLRAILRGPGWGGALFRALTRPGVIRYFLRRTWGADDIDEVLWQYDVLVTRQPGSEFAPLCFLSGQLFSRDIQTVYSSLTLPVWMSHGVRGDFTDYRAASIVADRGNWRIDTFQTGALCYFEIPQVFCAAYSHFLTDPPRAG